MLGLRLGRHIDGIVDAYYGPPELAKEVDSEPLTPPDELASEAQRLRAEAAGLDDPQRARFLDGQLDGIAATAERLAGQPLSYREEVRRCYGLDLEHVEEAELAGAHDELDELLPGRGLLRDRYQAWQRSTELPRDVLLKVLEPVVAELRRRTRALFGLPHGESAEVELVANQPWLGFNYYLGNLRSRIAVNTDVPTRATFVANLIAHEIYPGHHTERTWKEELLVRGRGYLDETILMIGTPQCVVAEGIASHALDALGTDAESECQALLAGLGHGYDLEKSRAVRGAVRKLAVALDNAGIMFYEEGADRAAVRQYLRSWFVDTDERIDKNVDFLLHPVWRAYFPIYEAGQRLVEQWTRGRPDRFRVLLTEQLTPSDLR